MKDGRRTRGVVITSVPFRIHNESEVDVAAEGRLAKTIFAFEHCLRRHVLVEAELQHLTFEPQVDAGEASAHQTVVGEWKTFCAELQYERGSNAHGRHGHGLRNCAAATPS